ncbi:hypothetical protein GCM10010912_08860 [Paenibacillus albidus]|uniref:SHOCT domain-containing protein n=1 Tax=Paenibacillus albidus TaxID=2041023 RepID=A0A917FBT9_9BACL|nr:hypothetical protein [Paenibacillus albidus]GGF66043.1 hypothetical protein GCM10010912_08860 [Paenibacillus albidus]
MNIKRVMIVGTMIVALSFGGTGWSKLTVNASPVAKWSTAGTAEKENTGDDLLEALNMASDETLYEALYDGKSLRDIAAERKGNINSVVQLQVAQLTEQLDARLASGSITAKQYTAHLEELKDIVTESLNTSL